ncbi:MAG TPA: hypothetical protein VNR64_03685, partial [Vicinamibacterales bacterium]|nr:hypothetical protein [Vicinamibacterales bacterium]
MPLIRALVCAALLAVAPIRAAIAQQPSVSSIRGSWTATVGTRPAFQGTWSAELRESTPDAATGTWTLVDAGGRVAAQGTWSATRTAGTWSGAWSARASNGPARSGTWRADAQRGAASFRELLRSTLEKQLTGAWRSA